MALSNIQKTLHIYAYLESMHIRDISCFYTWAGSIDILLIGTHVNTDWNMTLDLKLLLEMLMLSQNLLYNSYLNIIVFVYASHKYRLFSINHTSPWGSFVGTGSHMTCLHYYI